MYDEKELLRKLSKARAGLILRQGFLAPFVLRMPLKCVPDLNPETMATDGRYIYWHPGFVEECTLDQLKFVLCHEGLHPAFLHHTRMGDRDHKRWNYAGDYVINPILRNAGLKPTGKVLFNSDFDGKSADWVYDQLKPEDMPGGDGWNIGGVLPYPGKGKEEATPEENKIQEQEWITEFVAAAQTAKMIGTLPAGMERMIDELLTPKINYKAVLQRFLTSVIRNDYNWNRPNRRYIPQGLYLPHLQSPSIGNGVIFMDTSGSVGGRELNQLGSEVKAVTDAYAVDLDVIYVDAGVAGHDHIEAMNSAFNLKPKGGGGTSFVPGFEYVEQEGIQPKFALYLTDGGSHDFPELPPPYPLIWILTEEYHGFNPPFGEVLIMPRSEYDS